MFRFSSLFLAAALVFVSLQTHAASDTLSGADWKALLQAQPSGEHVIGKADAPVTIIEYASLTCPHCAEFHEKELPKLQKAYLDTGKAKLIFRGLTLNPLDTSAQLASRCLSDDKYFAYVSALYATQKTWELAEDPQAALLQVSKQAGFTKDSFEKCLRNQKSLDEINAVRKLFEEKVGPARTPTFIVNGKQVTVQPTFEVLEKLILAQSKS